MNIKDNPLLIKWVSIGLIFGFCFYQNSLKAQIGSIEGFNMINLSQKNELIFSVGRNFFPGSNYSDNLNAYDLQVAYAFNKHLAVQLGYHNFSLNNSRIADLCESNNCKKYYSNHLINIAIGGFFNFNMKKSLFMQDKKRSYKFANKAHLLLDAYLNYAKSRNITNYFNFSSLDSFGDVYSSSTLKFDSYYIQTNISYSGNFSGLSFSVIHGIIDFNKINGFGNATPMIDLASTLSLKSVYPFYGIQFKVWAGTKQTKLVYSIHKKTFLGKEDFIHKTYNRFWRQYYDKFMKQLSLQINLSGLKKSKRKSKI